eukprot:scaffold44411_cov21-Tisochrysis_lutea.AAC.1
MAAAYSKELPNYGLKVRMHRRTWTCMGMKWGICLGATGGGALSQQTGSKCSEERIHALTHCAQVGLTNYSAAYCVGLLVARRILTKLNLADTYKGQEEPDGEDYNVEPVEDGPRPFYCLLDTGLKRTSTGSKVFAAMKGALDGGLDIPHNEKRFVGYADKKLDAEVLQKYIYGGHVA